MPHAVTAANVAVATFGKRFATTVDGQVYSQPLYVPNLNITTGPNAGIHNTVLVATHDLALVGRYGRRVLELEAGRVR